MSKNCYFYKVSSYFIWCIGRGINVLLFCLFSILAYAQTNKPNIIFICTDDQAYWTLGTSGNAQAHTPNIDCLAKEGAYFTHAFATTPVCSPARAGIFSGQYASEQGILDFIVQPGHVLFNDREEKVGLHPDCITFAGVLRKTGYKTGLVGKWHLGDWLLDKSMKYYPGNFGFQYFMGLTGGGTTASNASLWENGRVKKFPGLTIDTITDRALKFIKSNKNNPFLLCLMFRSPHGPWLPVAPEDLAPFKNMDPVIPNPDYPDLDIAKVKRMMKEYLASVAGVDRNVGKVLKLLNELHISNETIVIFTSDNGYNMGHNGIWHKGNGIWATKTLPPPSIHIASKYRPNMYDNSLRVPAIIKWPGVTKPGTIINNLITNLDWYPTIVEMAGAQIPKDKIIRGESLIPLLKGPVKDWDNDFYGEYSMIHYSRALMRCYRTPDWKLIFDFLNPERNELYDLKTDPREHDNLIKNHELNDYTRSLMESLYTKIIQHMDVLHDPLLKYLKNNNLEDYPWCTCN